MDFSGTDSFTFTANDGSLDSNVATVTITVNPVNDAPVARAMSVYVASGVEAEITLDAFDVDGDALAYTVTGGVSHGMITSDDGDGVVFYTSDAGYAGTDTFTFTVSDGTVDSDEATVTITVRDSLVSIVSVSTGKPYSLATAQAGALPYIDRSYTVTDIHVDLAGGVLVRTANNDKYVQDPEHLKLMVGQQAVISVCYDRRWTALPDWLNDGTWLPTTRYVTTTDAPASPMDVFEKTVAPGEIVLGGNRSGGASGAYSNYVVIVKPVGEVGDRAVGGDRALFDVGPLAAGEWRNPGDADGDGLGDAFERVQELDAAAVDSLADGDVDETRPAGGGLTMYDLYLTWTPDDADDGDDDGGCAPSGRGSPARELPLLLVLAAVVLSIGRQRLSRVTR
jgi:hypothetical protein